ncbi:MAG: hypothetical protein WKF73_11595 [Nocardioidaceae bacterium]
MDADAGAGVSLVGQGRQPRCGGWVQRSEAVAVGRGDVMSGAEFDVAAVMWCMPEYRESCPVSERAETRLVSVRVPSRATKATRPGVPRPKACQMVLCKRLFG